MDAFVGLLDGPRAQRAFLLRTVMEPPWSLRIEDQAPISVTAVTSGDTWIVPDGDEPVVLHPGDVAIARGPEPYTVGDSPSTPPQVVIHPGQRCTTVDGDDMADAMSLGVRTWGNSEQGSAVMLVGTYELAGEIGQQLLSVLPPLIVLRHDTWDSTVVSLLASEIAKDQPGQEVVLDRLLDLLLVTALRTWFARPDVEAPRWFGAHDDPVVGHALQLLHNNPEHPWTVASLAGETGISRAALARRFTELLGEPPMTYLTNWRLALAADLLCQRDATIGAVARQVGYSSPFALSAAFKRVRGVSPQQHRAAVAKRTSSLASAS